MPKDTSQIEAAPPENDPVKFSFLLSGEAQKDPEVPPVNALSEEELAADWARSARTVGGLTSFVPDIPKKDDEPKPKETPPPEEKKEEPAGEPPPEEKPKKKVSFKEAYTAAEPAPKPEEPPAPAPVAPAPVAATQSLTDEDRAFIDSLPEEARDSVEFWSGAEKVNPDKYKGSLRKQLDYLRNHKAKMDELEENDPDTPVDENPKYLAWIRQNKPQISAWEAKKLEKEILIQHAEERAASRHGKELAELKEWKERQELERVHGPIVQQKAAAVAQELLDSFKEITLAKEVIETFYAEVEKHGDPKKAHETVQEMYPDETEIITNHHRSGITMAEELISIRSGLKKADVEGNRLHLELANRIIAQEDAMDKPEMAKARVREGKAFAKSSEYIKMTPDQRQRHWTFSDDEIISFIKAEVRHRAQKDLEAHQKKVQTYLTRYGAKSQSGKPAANKQVQAEPAEGPRHQGVETPVSGQQAPSKSGDQTRSRLLDWDY
jgi:hypothetical protein